MFKINEFRKWPIFHLIICVTFCISSLIINVFQAILYVTLRPFNRALYRNINYYFIYSMMSQLVFIAEWWSGSEVRVFASDETWENIGKEHVLTIMNHTYDIDWLIAWIVADRVGVLGASKVFMKNIMKYVPTVGWAWSCSDMIFLHRNWQEDKSIIEKQLEAIQDYPYPVWMSLFCEGTRFTYSKHKESMEVARKKGIPELKHHLLPRTRGFVLISRSIKPFCNIIYDTTIGFNTKDGAAPTLLNLLKGEKVLGEFYLRRLNLDEVPSDDEEAAQYIHSVYQIKDQLLDSYINTGSFTKENSHPAYRGRTLPRRYYSLINTVTWTILVFSMLLYYYYSLLLSTGFFVANGVTIAAVLIACVALSKMTGLTKIEGESVTKAMKEKTKTS